MGFLEDSARSSFQVGENNESVYVNKGLLFRMYIVSDSERAEQLLNYDRKVFKLFISVLILTILFADIKEPLTLAPIMILIIVELSLKRFLLRGLPRYKGKTTNVKKESDETEVYYPSIIYLLGGIGLLFAGLGIAFIFYLGDSPGVGIALFPLLIGTVIIGVCLYMLKVNKSNKAVELDAKKDSRHSL